MHPPPSESGSASASGSGSGAGVQQGWLDVLEAKITTKKSDFLKQSWLYTDRLESFGKKMTIETVKDFRPEEEEEAPLLDYDELEKMLYNDIGNPILDLTEENLDFGVAANATGEINLDSFIQDDVNVNVASSSGHVNLDDEDNDTWMH
ncbi:hypothetical protein RIF29_21279 [Crotalaria pallida]|uniref:Uncharacterized protein n=1 Tax=Crotalaria pallida TaxID=3830 RepID=A0AAN9FB96_CROPI